MQRLKTRAQFQAALAGGSVSKTAHFALHRCAPVESPGRRRTGGGRLAEATVEPVFAVSSMTAPDLRLGAMVPKRWARRAVTRNLMRRQIHAVAALFGPCLPPAWHVVRLRAAFSRQQFPSAASEPLRQAVRQELMQLFARVAEGQPAAARGGA